MRSTQFTIYPFGIAISSLIYLLFVPSTSAQSFDPLVNLCRRFDQQSTILNGNIYIDGGVQIYTDGGGGTGSTSQIVGINNNLLALDLASAWNWRNAIPISKVDLTRNETLSPPSLTRGALWPSRDNGSLYLYGGSTSRLNESFPTYADPTSDATVMWRYSLAEGNWSAVNLTMTGGQNVPRLSNGASASAPDLQLAFYYGGQIDNGTSEETMNMNGVQFSRDFLVFDLEGGSVTNLATDALSTNARAGGEMVYIPGIGERGILVVIGGAYKAQDVIDNNLRDDPVSMEEVAIFDVASIGSGDNGAGNWYIQNTTGDIPPGRTDFCLVVAAAQDNSSQNIYLYGGWNSTNHLDDVYILSIPSFVWTKVFQGSDQRESHTCHVIGNRQMLTVGGQEGNIPMSCDWEPNAIALFDMTVLRWVDNYNPSSAAYEIPAVITNKIGGSSTGGATIKAPQNGWAANLEQLFFPLPPNVTENSNRESWQPSRGGIIGIAIGGVLFLIVVVYAAIKIFRWNTVTAADTSEVRHELPEGSVEQRRSIFELAGVREVAELDDGQNLCSASIATQSSRRSSRSGRSDNPPANSANVVSVEALPARELRNVIDEWI